jgi:transcriptional pleiotropic regulator of transition state genes
MRATGIVRPVDRLGRIVLPKELRDIYDMPEGTAIGIYTEDDQIILKKYQQGCVICGEIKNLTTFKGKNVCKNCRKEMR